VSSDVEEFWCLALGPKKEVIASKMLFRGTVDSCLAHPRDVFRFAVSMNASSILIAHNHPSGELLPSMEDLRFTRQLVTASSLMEIPVIDHIVMTVKGYLSMRQDRWVRFEQDTSIAIRSWESMGVASARSPPSRSLTEERLS
jgi:DNA repair protein RadC